MNDKRTVWTDETAELLLPYLELKYEDGEEILTAKRVGNETLGYIIELAKSVVNYVRER